MKAGDPLIQAFKHVTFGMGTSAKRFGNMVTSWPPERELSPAAESWAWRLAYTYRRQLPEWLALLAETKKISHKWAVEHGVRFGKKDPFVCEACGNVMMSERDRNTPCRGTKPEVKVNKTDDKKRNKKVVAADKSREDRTDQQDIRFEAD